MKLGLQMYDELRISMSQNSSANVCVISIWEYLDATGGGCIGQNNIFLALDCCKISALLSRADML
jgi:hypothetical protein